jgi:hypothetical protein
VTLREKQSEFLYCLARLIVWVYDQRWELTLSEGYVGDTDAADGDHDGPHRKGGAHYNRLAVDLNLFVDGKWIKNSDHPAWAAIGRKWESMSSDARWGGRFKPTPDANHLSYFHEGKA